MNVKRSPAPLNALEEIASFKSILSWREILPELRSTGAAEENTRMERVEKVNVVIFILMRGLWLINRQVLSEFRDWVSANDWE